MTERIPSFGPMPEAEDFSADILPEVKNTDPQIDQSPLNEALISSVIESATETKPLELELDQAREGITPQKPATRYAPLQSVGQILGQQPPSNNQAVDPSSYVANKSTLTAPQRSIQSATTSSPSLSYRQAVKYGFAAALVFAAVIAVIIY